MQEYVVGFCFKADKSFVALIKKNRPAWQKNKFNGIGGKIEKDETPNQAMVREFKEEAGVETNQYNWNIFNVLEGEEFKVYCFSCFNDTLFNMIQTKTDEEIILFNTYKMNIREPQFISNLTWLIGMCIDEDHNRMLGEVSYESRS